ncbi:membrane protein [Enterobacterales bacterium]|nr:membrane protein [Enterobacterales bacterium]
MKRAFRQAVDHQQGSAMILSIMMMMSLGLLVLTTLGQHLSGALLLTSNEHRYLLAWEHAESSLNWGIRQSWTVPTDNGWQCQQQSAISGGLPNSLRSCIRPSLREGVFLLKGEGGIDKSTLPIALFQQTVATKAQDGQYVLQALNQGWLDFCPESDPTYCDEETTR